MSTTDNTPANPVSWWPTSSQVAAAQRYASTILTTVIGTILIMLGLQNAGIYLDNIKAIIDAIGPVVNAIGALIPTILALWASWKGIKAASSANQAAALVANVPGTKIVTDHDLAKSVPSSAVVSNEEMKVVAK